MMDARPEFIKKFHASVQQLSLDHANGFKIMKIIRSKEFTADHA